MERKPVRNNMLRTISGSYPTREAYESGLLLSLPTQPPVTPTAPKPGMRIPVHQFPLPAHRAERMPRSARPRGKLHLRIPRLLQPSLLRGIHMQLRHGMEEKGRNCPSHVHVNRWTEPTSEKLLILLKNYSCKVRSIERY